MNRKILKYIILDLVRSKFILAYTTILLCISLFLNYVSTSPGKTIISLLNIVLFIIPLVSIIFATIHFYNSKEFIEFLLTQPLARAKIFWCEYFAVSFALSIAFFISTGLPLLFTGFSTASAYLVLSGILLTFIFTAAAFLTSVITNDKVKGIGISIVLWLYLSVLFDGIVLMIFYLFRDYPVNNFIIVLTSLNPVDLSRILILTQLDISALMGFSGATFRNFFGEVNGKIVSAFLMLIWIFLPAYLSLRIFKRKNF